MTVVDRPYLPADPNVFRRRAEAAEPLNTEQQRNDRRDRLLRDMMDRRNQAMQRFQECSLFKILKWDYPRTRASDSKHLPAVILNVFQ